MWPYTDEEYDLFFTPQEEVETGPSEIDVERIYRFVEQVMLHAD